MRGLSSVPFVVLGWLATAFLLSSAAGAVDAQFASWCQQYSDDAVSQVARAQQLKCGFGGPRWDANRANHFNWCIAQDGAFQPPTTESLSRIRQLEDCEIAAQVTPAPTTPLPAPGQLPARTVTVQLPVDVYEQPDGNTRIGALAAGDQVNLPKPCQSWCNVTGPKVPAGTGWVYSGPDYNSLGL